MVKLEATKKDGNIIITEDSFEHLLACLDNQKFVGEPPQNGDSIAVGKEEYYQVQNEIQDAIDDFNRQCRALLHSDDPGCDECTGCAGIMGWKDVALKINKELIKFRRYGMSCSHILVGRKEYEEICKLDKADDDAGDEFTDNSWSIKIVKVDEDNYLAGAYIPTEEELQAKRIADLSA